MLISQDGIVRRSNSVKWMLLGHPREPALLCVSLKLPRSLLFFFFPCRPSDQIEISIQARLTHASRPSFCLKWRPDDDN